MKATNPTVLTQILQSRKVVICAGSGGVGKTTTSAIAGIAGGMLGKRTLILTIDPAKRLATSLGLKEVGAEPAEITPALRAAGLHPKAEVWAMMLDMSNTFDQVLRRFVTDQAQWQRIQDNIIYRHVTRTLSGSHEYAAMAQLADLYHSGHWDLIILDTPPTTHAMDFLEAPRRLEQFFKSRIMEILIGRQGRGGGLSLFRRGTDLLLTGLEKLIGSGLLTQITEFFQMLESLLTAFEQESARVEMLMASPEVEFVIVCGPSPAQTLEAQSFFRALDRMKVQAGAVVINRTLTPVLSRRAPVDELLPLDTAEGVVEQVDIAAGLQAQGRRELESLVGSARLVTVPLSSHDIYNVAGLIEIGAILFGPVFPGAGK